MSATRTTTWPTCGKSCACSTPREWIAWYTLATSRKRTLDALAGLNAPLYGVYGNNDVERQALGASARKHGFVFQDPPLDLVWDGRRIVVVHDPRDLPETVAGGAALALHGHTHMRRCERRGDGLVFNPGECAGHMKGWNAVGVVDLRRLAAEVLKF